MAKLYVFAQISESYRDFTGEIPCNEINNVPFVTKVRNLALGGLISYGAIYDSWHTVYYDDQGREYMKYFNAYTPDYRGYEYVILSINGRDYDYSHNGHAIMELDVNPGPAEIELKVQFWQECYPGKGYYRNKEYPEEKKKSMKTYTTGKVVVNFHGGNNFLFGNVSFWLEYLPVGKVPEEHQYYGNYRTREDRRPFVSYWCYNTICRRIRDFKVRISSVNASAFHKMFKENNETAVMVDPVVPLDDNIPANSTTKQSFAAPVSANTTNTSTQQNVTNTQTTTPTPIIPKKEEPKVIVRKKIIEKEYYDTAVFKSSMELFDYKIVGKDVIITGVNKSQEKIVIPNGVTTITSNAFGAMCNDLTPKIKSVYIPYSVNKIEKEAFKGNNSIQEVVIEANISEILQDTFKDCKSLTMLTFPSTLKKVGQGALLNTKLLEIFGPKNVIFSDTIGDIYYEINYDFNLKLIKQYKLAIKQGKLYDKPIEEYKKEIQQNINYLLSQDRISLANYDSKVNEFQKEIEEKYNQLLIEHEKEKKRILDSTYNIYLDNESVLNSQLEYIIEIEKMFNEKLNIKKYNEDFIILGSKLIAYTGKDNEITIPQNVNFICYNPFVNKDIKQIRFMKESLYNQAKDLKSFENIGELVSPKKRG